MKKVLLPTALLMGILLVSLCGFAQEPPNQGGGPWSRGQGQMPTVDQRLERLSQALDLTADQQEKIRPILENESTQVQALRADTALSQQDRMAKMKQIRENTTSQMNPILTADQQKKLAEMMSRMGRGPGGQGPPPPQQQQPPQ